LAPDRSYSPSATNSLGSSVITTPHATMVTRLGEFSVSQEPELRRQSSISSAACTIFGAKGTPSPLPGLLFSLSYARFPRQNLRNKALIGKIFRYKDLTSVMWRKISETRRFPHKFCRESGGFCRKTSRFVVDTLDRRAEKERRSDDDWRPRGEGRWMKTKYTPFLCPARVCREGTTGDRMRVTSLCDQNGASPAIGSAYVVCPGRL